MHRNWKETRGNRNRRRKFARYPPAIQNLSNKTRFEIVEGNELRKLQEEDVVWKEVIKWIMNGKVPKMQEVRGEIQEVISVSKYSILPCLCCIMGYYVTTVTQIQPSQDQRERDQGNRRETAGQTEPQEISQTDRETQITSSCEEGGSPPYPGLRRRGRNARWRRGRGGSPAQ